MKTAKTENMSVDRPFNKEVKDLAHEISDNYQIILDNEDGEFYGRGLEMPNVYGEGKTANACVKDTREALFAAVATMIEMNETPPLPAHDNARTEQVNIRLSLIEKDVLKALAKSHGFRGLGDFIRTRALSIK
jgi:predicted RNase H-like HicB family nuclease